MAEEERRRQRRERKVLLTAVFCSDIFLNPFPHLISLSLSFPRKRMPNANSANSGRRKMERTKKLSSVRNSACSPSVTVGQVHRFRHRTMPGKQRLKFIHSLRIYAQPHPVNMISKSVLSLYLATPAAVAALFVLVSTDHDDDSSMGKPPAPNWPTLRCHKWMRTIQSAPRAPLRKRERAKALV